MIAAEHAHVAIAAQSHEGQSGKNNEDRYGVSAYQVSESDLTPSVLAVVCDGIGGHLAGEVAAQMAVDMITAEVAASDASQPSETLTNAIIRAGEAIRDQSESERGQRGMGATCACVWLIGNRLFTASVGDSRIYLIRDQQIRQLSKDHTWVQEAIDYGALTPDQAKNHPNVHVIRRYLGSKQPVVPDLRLHLTGEESDTEAERNQGTALRDDDRLLICSDGLTDLVEDHEIVENLQKYSLEAAVDRLVDLANQRGGHDNITVIGLDLQGASTAGVAAPETATPRWAALTCFGVVFLVLVALVASVLIGWYLNQPVSLPLS